LLSYVTIISPTQYSRVSTSKNLLCKADLCLPLIGRYLVYEAITNPSHDSGQLNTGSVFCHN